MTVPRQVRPVPSNSGDLADAKRVVAGDHLALERIYRRHASRIYSLATWLGDPGDADDVTQEVFITAWERMETFRASGELGAWLRRVLINIVNARRRGRGARQRAELPLPIADEAPRTGGPDEIDRIALETALRRLPGAFRDVFVLHDVEGYTHEEISLLMQIAPGTSASRLHRARTMLRRELADDIEM